MPPLADPCPTPEAPSMSEEGYSTNFEMFTGQAAAMLVEGSGSGMSGALVGVDKGGSGCGQEGWWVWTRGVVGVDKRGSGCGQGRCREG